MRIDAHTHAMDADRDASGKLLPPLKPAWSPGKQSPEEYVAGCRDIGVDRVMVLDPPEIVFALKEIFGDFIIPSPQVDMDTVTPGEIEALIERGARGIKFIAPMHSYGDNRYFPLYDVIRKGGALAVFHTGYLCDRLFRPGGLLGRADYVDIAHMRPSALDRVGRAFPDLKVLMSHFGNPWWEEAWKVCSSHKNIYADLSGGTAYRRSMHMWVEMFKPNGQLDTAALGKLCFASDAGYCHPGLYTVGPYIEFHEKLFDVLGVPAELREQINRGNIEKLTARTQA